MADIEYTHWIIFPTTRLRVEIDVRHGQVQRFVVQLEYDVNWRFDETGPHDWKPVARFDHDPAGEFGHDIEREGLHLDVYRSERKERVERGFPRVPVNQAPGWCEDYLVREAKRYVNQFERWHGLRGP